MIKIKLLARQLDGETFVEQSPEFALRDGWIEGTLPTPAGVLPAGLWGKVPGGDPYLMHVCVLSKAPLAGGDFFELQSGPPTQPRARHQPRPSGFDLVLVRPTDRLRLRVAQDTVAIELLIESIGGEGELGSRLFGWARVAQASAATKATSAEITGPAVMPAWEGVFHLIHDSKDPDEVAMPPRGLVPLDAVLTFTRRGVGIPTLRAVVDDSFAGGVQKLAVTRSVVVRNNGSQWAVVGT
jgi:hypothetical protein